MKLTSITYKRSLAVFGAFLQLTSLKLYAQSALMPEPASGPRFVTPYLPPVVPPVRLANSSRLHDLIRAGNLYLSVQDAVALAIANSLDLEIERYGPLRAQWDLVRQQGGGPLRGAGQNSAQVGAVASGQGVLGSESSAGLVVSSGGSSGAGGAGNAVVQQVGYVAPNFDPTLTSASTFSHVTLPQPNQTASQTETLVDNTRSYQTQLQMGLVTGGLVRIQQTENYLDENAPTDLFNPSMSPRITLSVQQPFLQGRGINVNTYYIRAAQNNVLAADEHLRLTLLNLVANVLNQYWTLVSADEAVRAAQQAFNIAQKFADDTRERVRAGALAAYQVSRADAQLAMQRQALEMAQMQARQAEEPLKESITRVDDPMVESAQIVTTDRIEIPAADSIAPLRELVASATTKRPDLALARINNKNAQVRLVGTENPLLPTGIAYASTWNQGAATGLAPAFGQVFRRDFPTQYAGAYISAPLGNRLAQADYGIDQLQYQQSQLNQQRDRNQIVTEISNQVMALKQARAALTAAVNARQLQEQLLKAEQDKFTFGSSNIDTIVLAQRALVQAQTAEVGARGSYAHARVALDQALGNTLDLYHVSLEDGKSGDAPTVSGPSTPSGPADSAPAPASRQR